MVTEVVGVEARLGWGGAGTDELMGARRWRGQVDDSQVWAWREKGDLIISTGALEAFKS